MSTRHLVDPDLIPFVDARPPFEFTPENLGAVRDSFVEMRKQLQAQWTPRTDVTVEERYVPGPAKAPEVRVLVYAPKDKPAKPMAAYLHIHGGGYIVGTPEMGEPKNMDYAGDFKCLVVSVDYRLAPETPFPGPVEDCYAALKWLHANAASLGVDPNRIAIGGESAGGGLSAALALLTRDRGQIKLTHQQLIYPMIDDRSAASDHPYTGEFVWNHKANHFGWTSMLGHEPGREIGVSPYVAASRAESLEGLPPTFISTGALDLFLEEDLEYARRLMRAGVPVELHVYPGAIHGFDMAVGSRLAKQHARDQGEALKRVLAS